MRTKAATTSATSIDIPKRYRKLHKNRIESKKQKHTKGSSKQPHHTLINIFYDASYLLALKGVNSLPA